MSWPIKVATNAPTIPRTVVRIKPDGPFGPGDTKRAMRPATSPITMIQMIFDTMATSQRTLGLIRSPADARAADLRAMHPRTTIAPRTPAHHDSGLPVLSVSHGTEVQAQGCGENLVRSAGDCDHRYVALWSATSLAVMQQFGSDPVESGRNDLLVIADARA